MTTSAAAISHHPQAATSSIGMVAGPNLRLFPAGVIPRTRRAPPPIEDDVDLIGYILLVLLFLAAVWQ